MDKRQLLSCSHAVAVLSFILKTPVFASFSFACMNMYTNTQFTICHAQQNKYLIYLSIELFTLAIKWLWFDVLKHHSYILADLTYTHYTDKHSQHITYLQLQFCRKHKLLYSIPLAKGSLGG